MHLAAGSDFINAGQNVGLPFSGTAPDLGPFERPAASSTVYTFTGNGNWDVDANWQGGIKPPATVTAGSQIIIDPAPAGECLLNIFYKVAPGATLTVMSGKIMKVQGDLTIVN